MVKNLTKTFCKVAEDELEEKLAKKQKKIQGRAGQGEGLISSKFQLKGSLIEDGVEMDTSFLMFSVIILG